MRTLLMFAAFLFLFLSPIADVVAQDAPEPALSQLQRENEVLRAQLDEERRLRSVDRIAAAAALQERLRILSNTISDGIFEVRVDGGSWVAIGFIVSPEFVVAPLDPHGATLQQMSRRNYEARLMNARGEWHDARFIGYREHCGCAVLRVNEAVGSSPAIQADVFRGQVVYARGPWEGTLLGLIGNRRDLYIELDMANRGPVYGPVYDMDGALLGVITNRVLFPNHPERADVYFAVPAPLLAQEARLILEGQARR